MVSSSAAKQAAAQRTASLKSSDFDFCPFTISIDSNESAPWSFHGITSGSGEKKRPVVVKTVRKPLWATERRDVTNRKGKTFNVGLADYSIEGMELDVQIERKSVSDLFSTLGERRDKFECEIKRLNEDCRFAAVVVEGGWDAITLWRNHGPKPQSVIGTILAWMTRYPRCHWLICPSRSAAERLTFRLLERVWEDTHSK